MCVYVYFMETGWSSPTLNMDSIWTTLIDIGQFWTLFCHKGSFHLPLVRNKLHKVYIPTGRFLFVQSQSTFINTIHEYNLCCDYTEIQSIATGASPKVMAAI